MFTTAIRVPCGVFAFSLSCANSGVLIQSPVMMLTIHVFTGLPHFNSIILSLEGNTTILTSKRFHLKAQGRAAHPGWWNRRADVPRRGCINSVFAGDETPSGYLLCLNGVPRGGWAA